jgi:glyceraldehyde 3-phosphate dehydrogenase
MLRVGINGFGRIGRAIFRINMIKKNFEVVAINDSNPSNENLAYMLKYDSTYGRLNQEISATETGMYVEELGEIPIHHDNVIDSCPWDRHGVDIVIDSSGVYENLMQSDTLRQKGIKHQVITHAPEKIGKPIILEVNEHEFNKEEDFYVSSSICDANAFAPVMHLLETNYGIDHGFLTTLHPWLSYQNLLDGPCRSFAYPGHIHENFTLGRNSINALIPKTTSCVKASALVLPYLEGKFQSLSYRVPTSIVSSADISVKLKKKTNKEEVIELFRKKEKEQKFSVFHNNFEPLISTDFVASEYTAIIDQRWTEINDANYLKLILWYDNEWGYSSRVVDIVKFIEQQY